MGVDIAKAQAMWATARGAIGARSSRPAGASSVESPITETLWPSPNGGLVGDGVGGPGQPRHAKIKL